MNQRRQALWLSRIRYSGVVGIAAALLGAGFSAVVTNGLKEVYVWSRLNSSLAGLFMALTFPTALVVTAAAYRRLVPDGGQDMAHLVEKRRSLLIGRLSISLVFAFLLTALCMITFVVLSNTFVGAKLERWAAVAAGSLYAGVLAFAIAYVAVLLDRAQMLMISGLMLVVGLAAAAAASTEKAWFAGALRFLGYTSGAALIFSLTFILTGFVVVAWALDIVYQLELLTEARQFPRRGFRVLRVCLVALGFFFVGVGLFPDQANTVNGLLHGLSAHALFLLFAVLVVSVRLFTPIHARWFVAFSLLLAAFGLASGLLWSLAGALDSAVLEIILVLTITPWVFLFEQQTRGIIAAQAAPQPGMEGQRLRFSGVMALVSGVVSGAAALLMVNGLAEVPLFQPQQLSGVGIMVFLTALVSVEATVVAYRRCVPEDVDIREIATLLKQPRSILAGRLIVAGVVGALLTAIAMLVAYVLGETLPQQRIDARGVVALAAGYGALLGFGVTYVAVYLDRSQLLVMTGVIVGVGIIMAAVSAVDPNWWRESISFLGQDESGGLFFNLAFILAGLLVLVFAWDVLYELRLLMLAGKFARRNYRMFEMTLYSIGLLMAGIGLFPIRISGLSYALHNLSAHGVVGVFVVLMFAVGWLAPIYPRGFLVFGWVMGAGSVASILLWQRGIFNFVFMELVLLLIVSVWFYVFEQETREYIERQEIDDFRSQMAAKSKTPAASINSP